MKHTYLLYIDESQQKNLKYKKQNINDKNKILDKVEK